MLRFRIRTNWTNSVSKTYEFGLDDLADAAARDRLKWAFSDPERLRPGESRQSLTERAAASFATVAQALRERGHDPHRVAHFVNRLVFCMFADDVGLLPDHMFTRMLEQARRAPAQFADLAGDLFRVMARGGRVGFETVDWFNGGLFDDDATLPLERSDLDAVLAASNLDWSEIDPSILGTLFERGLDPGKRAQLGAHYTDRDKIMLLVEPVVIRPWLAEWTAEKAEIAAELERAEAARSPAARTKRRNEAERRYRAFLNRLRAFTVLDPACGSGNFLYLALQALKDLEHRVQFEAEALGFQRAFPEIGPANVKGIELNPYAAELARVSVWIGEIQWMRRNGFSEARDPILKPLDTIECRDAIVTPDDTEPDWPDADVVIGNPPFLGGKLLITHLGEDYVSRMFKTYAGRVPAEADLVCYWSRRRAGRSPRAGRDALVAERSGGLRIIRDGVLDPEPIRGMPEVHNGFGGRLGLWDVAVHPQFAESRLVYFTYLKPDPSEDVPLDAAGFQGIAGTSVLARGRFDGASTLTDVEDIFVSDARVSGFSVARLIFAPDGKIFMSIGMPLRDQEHGGSNRVGTAEQSQEPGSHAGKILRLNDDGTAPEDNPFVGDPAYRPEIYALGFRDPLGLIIHPETGELWEVEHGPQGGDELNIVRPGRNYGWPIVSYGRAYTGEATIGAGGTGPELPEPCAPGMEQPLLYWYPVISPGGMALYTGDAFPAWKGSLFVGGMSTTQLQRIVLNQRGLPVRHIPLLTELNQRIRDVKQGPDGLLYVTTDHEAGAVLRIEPLDDAAAN